MKKFFALMLCLLMVVGMMPAIAEEGANVNMFGWEIPDETITFTAYMGSASPDDYAEDSAAMHDYLLENFNVDITLQVFDNDATERLNLMLAGNDYPDVIVCSIANSVPWLEQGRAVDLTDLVTPETTPNLVARYGKYLDRLYDENGKLYTLASSWGMSGWADYAPQVRYDWYVEIGEPDVSTPEAYYEAVKQMVANHPTNANGEKTYAFGGYTDSSNSVMRTWLSMWGIKKFWSYDEENNMTFWPFTDEAGDGEVPQQGQPGRPAGSRHLQHDQRGVRRPRYQRALCRFRGQLVDLRHLRP